MRRLAGMLVLAVALTGCVQVATQDEAAPARTAWQDAFDPYGFGYNVTGLRLVEAVVPGDMVATEARLPAGYEPVDYGAYWGGPATGDSAVSVVVLDGGTYEDGEAARDHAEVLVGAYVEVAVEDRAPDIHPFYVFDVATTNPAYRADLADAGWQALLTDRVEAEAETTGLVQADASGPGWSVGLGGAFPAGDTTTGTFTFENHHVDAKGRIRQRLDFASFSYRTAPVELTVDGLDVLVDLVGDGTTRGMGYHGWEVGYDATVTLDRSDR